MDVINFSALHGGTRRQPCVSRSTIPSASAYVSSHSFPASHNAQRPSCLEPLSSRVSSSPRILSRHGDKSSVGLCGGSRSSTRRPPSWTAAFLAVVFTFCCRSDRASFCADAVSSGEYHSCTVFEDGTVKCWGLNTSGQLGVGDSTNRGGSAKDMGDSLPEVDLGTGFFAVAVSAGFDHTCAMTAGGKLKCWGDNSWGQLGYEDTLNRGNTTDSMGDNLPYVDVGTGAQVLEVVAARQYTCVHLRDESVRCFGRNDEGQLGIGISDNRGDAPDEMGDELPAIKLAAVGANLTIHLLAANSNPCVVLSSTAAVGTALKCWGPNGYGQLGLGDTYNRGDEAGEMGEDLLAISLGTDEEVSSIAAGHNFHCALLTSGGVKCWGRNTDGQCGGSGVGTLGDDGEEMGDDLPYVDLGSGRTAVTITAGDAHACALLDDGTVKCWGKGFYGAIGLEDWRSVGVVESQMGDNLPAIDLGTSAATDAKSSARRQLRGAYDDQVDRRYLQTTETYLDAGGHRSCAILDGSVKCWGRGWAGALGLGDEEDRGDQSGSMGDSLPFLELGTGKVAVAPVLSGADTIAPTPSPSPASTRALSLPPTTLRPTPAPVAIPPTPIPITARTPAPMPAPSPAPTPAPTIAPTVAAEVGGFRGIVDDVGVSMTQGYVIAGGVPVALLILCCCFGFLCATKNRDKDHPKDNKGDERSVSVGTAAPIGPASGTLSSASICDPMATQPSSSMFCATVGMSGKKNQDPHVSRESGLFVDPKFNNHDAPLYADTKGVGHVSDLTFGAVHAAGTSTVSEVLTSPEKNAGDDDAASTLGSLVGRGVSSSDTPPQHSWGPAQSIKACASGTPEAWGRNGRKRLGGGGVEEAKGGGGNEESKS